MICPMCGVELADGAEKSWLVEEAGDVLGFETFVCPEPVCRACARKLVGKRGPRGRKVLGFKLGASKPAPGGLILRK
jgi:hypothetical protein